MRKPDRTLELATLGYEFISSEARVRGSDVFDVSLLGRPVTCLTGPEAAAVFYDESMFERRAALPNLVKETLLGQDGVQTLDGATHRARKAMFMSLMTPHRMVALSELAAEAWDEAAHRWARNGRVVLFDAAGEVLARVACAWAGVPLPVAGSAELARTLVEMVDGFATLAPRHWRARRARKRAELWARKVIRDIRADLLRVPEDTAASTFARGTDGAGKLLPVPVAAVELLNVVRPTVAVCWYVAFAGHALHRGPQWRERLRDSDAETDHFVQEVRRFYPFAPFLGARVRRDFSWQGHELQYGRLTLLDVYGINHDPRVWDDPEVFDPNRFAGRVVGPYHFIPHGGGRPETGHRCAGEQVTVELLKPAVRLLARLDYHVPGQDLRFPLNRIPSRLRSGFLMTGIRVPAAATTEPEPA
jgi:fatty-acid peroxygenase